MIIKLQFGEDIRRIAVERLSVAELRALCVRTFGVHNAALKYVDPDGDKVSIVEEEDLQEACRLAQSAPLRVLVFAQNGQPPKPAGESQSNPDANPLNDLSDLFSRLGINSISPNLSVLAQQLSENLSMEEIGKLPVFLQTMLSSALQNFPKPSQPEPQTQSQAPSQPSAQGYLHPNIFCDGCEGPVAGNRYKCTVCVDYDLCEACEAKKTHNHPLQTILPPAQDPRPVHEGIRCDGCQQYIQGIRYKCNICFDYDLCEACEGRGVHPADHPLVKFVRPAARSFSGPCRGRGGWRRMARQNCRPVPARLVARYVEDVTIPDGTILPASSNFLKVWKLKNEGAEPWPQGTKAVFLGGDDLSYSPPLPLDAVAPGAEVNVAVEMVTPAQPGRYSSYYRLEDANGNRFGQRFWSDILVAPNHQAPEVPVPAPAPAPVPAPVPAPAAVPSAPPAFDELTEEQRVAINTLQGLGYSLEVIQHAFEAANGNVSVVLQALL